MNNYAIKDVMRRCKIAVFDENTPLVQVIDQMDTLKISAMPISRANQLVGVLSKSDIVSHKLLKFLQDGVSLTSLRAKDLMNLTPPVRVFEDQLVRDALKIMHRRHIHRVFVSDAQNRLTGVLSTTDLLHLMIVEG